MHREVRKIIQEVIQLNVQEIEKILHEMNPNISISKDTVLSLKQTMFLYDHLKETLPQKPVTEIKPSKSAMPTMLQSEHEQKSKSTNKSKKAKIEKKVMKKEDKPKVEKKKSKKYEPLPLTKQMFSTSSVFDEYKGKSFSVNTKSSTGKLPPEFYADKQRVKEKNIEEDKGGSRIINSDYKVPKEVRDSFRKKMNLKSKEYVRKSLKCEICDQYYIEGYRYTDLEGWISYLCKSCARQIGGSSGRKLIISIPMGGQNKRY